MNFKLLSSLFVIGIVPFVLDNSYAQMITGDFGDSPFERKFGDVKYLDSYFGTVNNKMEVNSGDQVVPFTVIFANVGTQDITGIRGQLSPPLGFSSPNVKNGLIFADSNSNSLAGDLFSLTFFVNIDENTPLQEYPASVDIDYSRLRESGIRTASFNFNFMITGDSIVNVRPLNPILMSLEENNVIIEITNDGTATISGVNVVLQNTDTATSLIQNSVTNVENVVILDSNWHVGTIPPKTSKYITTSIYVPSNLKGETFRAPLEISYINAHGDQYTITRIADFFINGKIIIDIYDVQVKEVAGKKTIIGSVINEGNDDALFSFVTIEPSGNSNIKLQKQFIDEIGIDSPVPFNVPLKFDGEPVYGINDIKITVRYKDSVRNEIFETLETSIFIEESTVVEEHSFPFLAILGLIMGVGVLTFMIKKRSKINLRNIPKI